MINNYGHIMDKSKFNKCITQILHNNLDGLEQIYYEYFGKIIYTAMIYTRDYHASEDIASDIILYILQNANVIGVIEDPNAWINNIAKKRAIDYIRKDSHSIKVSEFDASKLYSGNFQNNEVLFANFITLTSKLTEHEQQLIELHYIYGYKYKELSKILNLPVGTIKSQIYAIKNKIKEFKKYL